MAYALDIGMRVIPVFLKSAQEKQRFPIRISRRSRIDFRIPERNSEAELVRAIRRAAERHPGLQRGAPGQLWPPSTRLMSFVRLRLTARPARVPVGTWPE